LNGLFFLSIEESVHSRHGPGPATKGIGQSSPAPVYGDVFKVQVVGTTIQYIKNNEVLANNTLNFSNAMRLGVYYVDPTFPLHVYASFQDVGDEITDVTIYSICTSCPAGKYSSATSCSTCPGGKYSSSSNSSNSACSSCANGTYLPAWSNDTSNDNIADCADCPAGKCGQVQGYGGAEHGVRR
jgi:hypothetical protein